jgi:cytoskeletal protein RodZ
MSILRRIAFVLAAALLAVGIVWWVSLSTPPPAAPSPAPAPAPRATESVTSDPAPAPEPAPTPVPEPAAPAPATEEKTFIDPDGIEMRETPQGPRPVRPL